MLNKKVEIKTFTCGRGGIFMKSLLPSLYITLMIEKLQNLLKSRLKNSNPVCSQAFIMNDPIFLC